MKVFKKTTLIALVALLSFGFANAQVGIQAGYDLSKDANKDASLNGFHVGPTYNMSIQGPISLQYGLLYNYLTKKEGDKITSTTTAHRLDIPVRVAASFPFASGFSAFVFGGPNFNFGFMQKTTTSAGSISGSLVDNIYKVEKPDGKKLYSPFDLQLGVGGGIQFNNFGIKVSYDWGMLDRNTLDNITWKNNDLKVGLFYNF